MKRTFIPKLEKLLSYKSILILVILSGFLIRFLPIRTSYHYWDETVYLQHAEIITGLRSNNYNEFEFRPPLFPILLGGIFLISHSLIAAHFLVAALSTLGIFLTFYLGDKLFNKRTGIVASLIYFLSEENVSISHAILLDSILPIFWLLVAIFTFKITKKDKKSYYVLAGVFSGLAILLKFTSLVLPIGVILTLFINKIEKYKLKEVLSEAKSFLSKKELWLYLISTILILSPYLIWSQISYGGFLHTFKKALKVSGAEDPAIIYLESFGKLMPLPFVIGLIFFGLKLKKWEKTEVNLPIIFFFVLMIPLYFLIQNSELRFTLPIMPFAFLMAASGFEELNLNRKHYIILVIGLTLVSASHLPKYQYISNLIKGEVILDSWWPEVYKAAIWMKNKTPKDSILYTNYRWPALGYYSKRKIVLMPVTRNFQSRIGEVLNQPGYVFYSENAPEGREPNLKFLQNDSRFLLNKTFDGVKIFYYKG